MTVALMTMVGRMVTKKIMHIQTIKAPILQQPVKTHPEHYKIIVTIIIIKVLVLQQPAKTHPVHHKIIPTIIVIEFILTMEIG